jgi:hypothetical protein
MFRGKGSCAKPKEAKADSDDDKDIDPRTLIPGKPKPSAGAAKDNAYMDKMMSDPAKMDDFIRKQLPPEAKKTCSRR